MLLVHFHAQLVTFLALESTFRGQIRAFSEMPGNGLTGLEMRAVYGSGWHRLVVIGVKLWTHEFAPALEKVSILSGKSGE